MASLPSRAITFVGAFAISALLDQARTLRVVGELASGLCTVNPLARD